MPWIDRQTLIGMPCFITCSRVARLPRLDGWSALWPKPVAVGWAMLLAALLVVVTAARGGDPTFAGKIDDGLDDRGQTCLIFVPMADQLLSGRGDYERFCEKYANATRRELRPVIVAALRANAERSWGLVAGSIERLERAAEIKNVEKFWIVNGFASEATGAACRQLAALEAVSFVYLQRGPFRQQKMPEKPGAASVTPNHKNVFERVVAGWHDDSDEPFTTKDVQVPWNLRAIQADAAWKQEKAIGRGVVVALLDSGLMVAPALTSALWKNPGEVFNGRDDDGDGYVDDLLGYDFQADTYYCLGDNSDRPTHGSMCGGIIAGRSLNKMKLVTGVAPRARLMVLRGMGYLNAYEYALAHGADVMSMSYMWVDMELGNYRGVFRTAHEHLAAAGVVAVGGAGNFSDRPEGRQITLPKDIPCVIATVGLTRDGNKTPASSQGPCTWTGVKFYDDYPKDKPLFKPDVTALFTGFPMWGRPDDRGGKWTVVSLEDTQMALVVGPGGNSFAGPHAAGVAALMLSVNPDLCAWEVKTLMENTCRDIGPKGRDYIHGAGLLQAQNAVQAARKKAK